VNEMVQNGQLLQNNWKGEFFNKNKAIKAVRELKKNYPFLKEADSIALQKAVENVNDSYTRYYKKQNRAPRFKSKKNLFNRIPRNMSMEILPYSINISNCPS